MDEKFQKYMKEEIEKLRQEGLYNFINILEGPQDAWVHINGRELLNFSSNNYLGLANNPQLVKAARKAIEKYGVGPGAVRTIAGTMEIHQELEEKMAKFKKVEAVLTLQSGSNTNLAVIPAIVGKGDTIYSDELNHASIIDGCRLSEAEVKVFKHRDMDNLRKALGEKSSGRKLIITDGVFSMDGTLAKLPDIVELAKEYNALTLVDDAHGEGVMGSHGRGIVDHFNLHGEIDIEVGTFSKALGTIGGYAGGNKILIEYLRQKARPFLFSSAVTPPDIVATIKAIEILQKDNSLISKLWSNGQYFKQKMEALGFDVGHSQTPITPVMIGDAEDASDMSAFLFEEGVFAQSIGFPTVPRGKARIRVMISAVHSRDDIDFALGKFKMIGKEMNLL